MLIPEPHSPVAEPRPSLFGTRPRGPSLHPASNLAAYGWNDRWLALFNSSASSASSATSIAPAPASAEPGRIIRHDGTDVLVAFAAGTRHLPVRSSMPPLAVGDWLAVAGDVLVDVLARSSLLRRHDPSGGGKQLLAANVDVVAIVCGLDRPLKPGRILRAITLAWDAGATPVLVLTKADVASSDGWAETVARAHEAAPGVDVLLVSSYTSEGLDAVRAMASGRTVVFLGESGAGKSTLTNALIGADVASTGRVRTGDAKGRHTTTARELHLLPGGGCLIDTPGLRAVGLWTDVDTVDRAFGDVTGLAEQCRFSDCSHQGEPGCAVADAVDAGALAGERFDSWQRLRREAAAAERRADPRLAHQDARRFGRIAREAQRLKRPRS